MKNKIICLVTCIILFCVVIFANAVNVKGSNRIHQHLSNTKEVKTDDVDEFNTHLPIVTIDTNGLEIPGEAKDGSTINSNIKIYDDETKNNYLTDVPKLITEATIRARGNSSLHFDKKGYLLKFINEDGSENKQEVMGMDSHDEWILNGPFLDKTLIRNYMCYNISAEIMGYAPNVRFCEVFINNEYKGLYLMLESISRSDNGRINVSKYEEKNNYTGYIVRIDRGSTDEMQNVNSLIKYGKLVPETTYIDIIYPPKTMLDDKIKLYIERDMSKLDKALYSFDYDEPEYGYENYINTDNFVDYFIINEFTQNYDAGGLSTYLYKDVRGKFNLCVWDFNNAFDNYQESSTRERNFEMRDKPYFYMLTKDEKFNKKVIERYKELRKTYFSEEYLMNYIDETIAFLGDAIDRNFEVWGYSFDSDYKLLTPSERDLHSYDEAVEQLKKFIKSRCAYLDENIESLLQFSHESAVKTYNH